MKKILLTAVAVFALGSLVASAQVFGHSRAVKDEADKICKENGYESAKLSTEKDSHFTLEYSNKQTSNNTTQGAQWNVSGGASAKVSAGSEAIGGEAGANIGVSRSSSREDSGRNYETTQSGRLHYQCR